MQKKSFTHAGQRCVITVLKNHSKQIKTVHNRSTHDEESRTNYYHQVKGTVNGEVVYNKTDFQDWDNVTVYVEEAEGIVKMNAERTQTAKTTKTTEAKLKDLGFKKY